MENAAIKTPSFGGLRALGKPAVLDRIEQFVIVLLWLGLVHRVVGALEVNKDAWLVVISETSLVIFTIVRRPTKTITLNLGDWLLAVTATAAPLMILPSYNLFPQVHAIAVAMVMVGNVGQAVAKLSLRRSFGIAPANRGVIVGGAYRFVRHPMYAGYLLVHIGILLLMPSPVNFLIYAIGWTAQIRRLKAEEDLLGRDPQYRAYMQKVRWRLVPGVF